MLPISESLDQLVDTSSTHSSQYINCFVVASRGRLQKESWIKPYSALPTDTPADGDLPLTYSATLTRDVGFKMIDRSSLPAFVKAPKGASCKLFVVDENLTDVAILKGADPRQPSDKPFGRHRDSGSRRRRKDRTDVLVKVSNEDLPPPVPPKPTHFYKSRNESGAPKLKPRKYLPLSDSAAGDDVFKGRRVRQRSTDSLGDPIQLPRRRAKASNSTENPMVRETGAKGNSANIRIRTPETSPVTSAGDTMNYNISTCSSSTLTYDKCLNNDDDDANSYESVDHPRSPHATPAVTSQTNMLTSQPLGSDLDSIYGMYSEPYESTSFLRLKLAASAEESSNASNVAETPIYSLNPDNDYQDSVSSKTVVVSTDPVSAEVIPAHADESEVLDDDADDMDMEHIDLDVCVSMHGSESSMSLSDISSACSEPTKTHGDVTEDKLDHSHARSSSSAHSSTNSETCIFVSLASEYSTPGDAITTKQSIPLSQPIQVEYSVPGGCLMTSYSMLHFSARPESSARFDSRRESLEQNTELDRDDVNVRNDVTSLPENTCNASAELKTTADDDASSTLIISQDETTSSKETAVQELESQMQSQSISPAEDSPLADDTSAGVQSEIYSAVTSGQIDAASESSTNPSGSTNVSLNNLSVDSAVIDRSCAEQPAATDPQSTKTKDSIPVIGPCGTASQPPIELSVSVANTIPPPVPRRILQDRQSEGEGTYEEIDDPSKSPTSPRLQPRSLNNLDSRRHVAYAENIEAMGGQVLFKDDLVIADSEEVYSAAASIYQPLDSNANEVLGTFRGTQLVYDKNGNAFYIPNDYLLRVGDPSGQPWFYPVEITSRQAALFLREEKQEGCFLVYKPPSASPAYALSVCRNTGDVLHYNILEGHCGNMKVEGHDHTFTTLVDLVEYFKRNKSYLVTRLRRPLKEAKVPITPGYHYDSSYELHRQQLSLTGKIIGTGNFGFVCAGVYQHLKVAVKVLQDAERGFESEDDFLEEARVLMDLNHEHVVQIIGVSFAAHPLYIVTEFVPQGSLKDCLRSGVIPSNKIETLLTICCQILSALAYLEGLRYVLHRDLAARNFLVTETLRIKLADFGRARRVIDDHYQAPRSEKISVKWAAPEVLATCDYSTKSDVWAAGVVMWETFNSGERPYDALTAEQTVVYVTEGGRLYRPAQCLEAEYIAMTRCWHHVPSARPSFRVLHQQFKRTWMDMRQRHDLPSPPPPPANDDDRAKRISQNMVSIPIPPRKNNVVLRKESTVPDGIRQRFSVIRDALSPGHAAVKAEETGENKIGDSQTSQSSSSELSVRSVPLAGDLTTTEKLRKSFRKFLRKKSKSSPSPSLSSAVATANGGELNEGPEPSSVAVTHF